MKKDIECAIESARCRIYKLKAGDSLTYNHQVKAENQKKLMEVTISALEKQIPKKMIKKPHTHLDLTLMYVCPNCETEYNRFYEGKPYCMFCGQKIDWSDEE